MSIQRPHNDAQALEQRFALQLAAGLSGQAAALPHDITERLRVAREQALVRAREVRRVQTATAPAVVMAGSSRGGLLMGTGPAWWQRLASMVPLAMLVGGLVLIQHQLITEQVQAAAEIDASLLADDLPPAAYSDPGFAEFLKAPQP